jgi:hypothetical protein
MRKNELITIRYTKVLSEGTTESTERVVIPTTVPGNIKALDITDLAVEERDQIVEYHIQYAKYISNHMKQAFSFEDWLSHSKNVDFTPKWRTFKPEQTEIL